MFGYQGKVSADAVLHVQRVSRLVTLPGSVEAVQENFAAEQGLT